MLRSAPLKWTAAILSATVAMLFCPRASGQEGRAAGFYNSPRGFGLVFQQDAPDHSFNSFTMMADTYGLLKNKCGLPGVRFNFSRNFIMLTTGHQGCEFEFFAGPGASLGYLRDFEKNYYSRDNSVLLEKNPGIMTALSGTGGCHFRFSRRVDVELSWMVEIGFHLRKDEDFGNWNLAFFKNGIVKAINPQLMILYKW